MDAYQVVRDFEKALSDYTGAPFVVVVDSCSNALRICLEYCYTHAYKGEYICNIITIPNRTYPSVPCAIKQTGFKVEFEDLRWTGAYQLKPYPIWDCAKRLRRGMYEKGQVQCISFHGKKHLPIGRGGAILTDSNVLAETARWMRFDGRPEGESLATCKLKGVGFNCYMTPEQAARGLELLQFAKDEYPEAYEAYQDLSQYGFYG